MGVGWFIIFFATVFDNMGHSTFMQDIEEKQFCLFPGIFCKTTTTTTLKPPTTQPSSSTPSPSSTTKPPRTTRTPVTVTPSTTTIATEEENDPGTSSAVRDSDPFYRPPEAEQLKCDSVGVDCKNNCTWINWLKIYNKTVDASIPAVEYYHNTDEKTCFQRCNQTSSCVLYTFSKVGKTCKIHDHLNFEDVRNDTDWNLHVHISPKYLFLSEWVISRNNVPRGEPLSSWQSSNFFNCTLLCVRQQHCEFAVLDRNDMTCNLYSKYATQLMGLQSNLVSIQHASLLRDDNLWRFGYVGPIYQLETPTIQASTVESMESCLENCHRNESCHLATTTATNQSTVDCFLYEYYDNVWYEDDPPSTSTNSYYKVVTQTNTLFKKFANFVGIASTAQPIEQTAESNMNSCQRSAMDSKLCYYFVYDSNLEICKLYDSSVQMLTSKKYSRDNVTTFSKSIPNKYLPYYAFESFWMANVSLFSADALSPDEKTTGLQCLGKCLQIENCSAVAIQRPEGNCTLYNQLALDKIVKNNQNQSTDAGLKSTQVFVKIGDPRFIESDAQYRCTSKKLVSWDDINHILQFNSLDQVRKEIPVGNNPPLPPHGGGFEGQGNETAAPPSGTNRKVGKTGDDKFRWQRHSKEWVGQVYTWDIVVGSAIGGSLGGAPGAFVGTVVGAAVATVTVALDNIICFFSSCDKKEEKPSCDTRCNSRAIDRFLELVFRASDCVCHGQPRVLQGGNLVTDDNEEREEMLQDDCDGRRVGEECHICCRVGYEPERNPVCTCSDNSANFWDPNPARCVGKRECTLPVGVTNWGDIYMPMIPVTNCRGGLYYGLVFNLPKRIPFYTIYHFGYRNRDLDKPTLDRESSWVAFPCTEYEIATHQLTNEDYAVLNSFPGAKFDRGHLTPNADLRFRRDSVKSTFIFANAAPQDHHANSVPWRVLESRLRNLFSDDLSNGEMRQGYVLTGVCLDDDAHYSVPDCFWKLACTRTDDNQVTVAGFYHRNIISNTDQEKVEREREVYQIRDQREMPDMGRFNPADIWREAAEFFQLQTERDTLALCQAADRINFPPNLLPTPKTEVKADQENEYALFNFWNDKVFGEGFDETVKEIKQSGDDEDDGVGESESGSPPSCGKKVVGYVTGWSDVKFTQNAASYLTHVIFAFVQMTADGTLVVGSADPENSKDVSVDRKKSYLRLYEIKAAKEKSGNRLATIFAVGGWANSQYYSAVASSQGLTLNFIRTALEILDYFNMDGIDIDWEYPVTGGANEGVKQDRENYLTFLQSLKSALAEHQASQGRSKPYSLTIAGAAGSWVLEDGFDLPAIAEIVDWINVMTYDYYGAWESKWGAYTGPHAPLYFGAPQGYSGKTNVDYTLKYYSCRIQNPDKLVMGLGFYGRFWNHSGSPVGEDPLWRKATPNAAGKFDGGFEPWRNIARLYLKDPSFRRTFHKKTLTPYLENSAGFLMGYEDAQSIHEKVKYASAKKFAGVMIWAIDLDDDRNSLLRIASSESLCSGGGQAGGPSDYKCPPIQEQRWWTLLDDEKKAGMCGKAAPLYKGYYPVCDPEDPGYACCSASGYCGSGDKFCKCDGCVDYYENPDKILDEPIKPDGPVRWHTMDKFQPGPQCGYNGHLLENGEYAICNPDDDNGYCCSAAGYCGKTLEFCECEGCVDFREDPDYQYPEKTWIDSGPDAGKCGKNAQVNGKPATCNPLSNDYYCCSASGYCGHGAEYCDCEGCVNYKDTII